MPTATDQTSAILDRLTTAHGVIDDFDFTYGKGNDFDDAFDVIDSIRDCGDHAVSELVDTFASLAALLFDAGTEIARLSAENAGLRAREGR